MARLELSGIRKNFGTTEVLKGIDLTVEDGELVAFVGPSGCGKSTLLRLICGLDEITAGNMAIDGEIVNDVPPSKRGIAMVFQSYALYPHMSVADNMGYALRLAGTPKGEIKRRVEAAAKVLRIDPYLERKPRQLSGGQRQRVAIGRAITREPRIFLFDEPLSNLDAALRVEMRIEIARMKERLGTTMVYVTHDQIEAMTLADKIVVMHAGKIEQIGSPLDLYNKPQNKFVAGFIGSPRSLRRHGHGSRPWRQRHRRPERRGADARRGRGCCPRRAGHSLRQRRDAALRPALSRIATALAGNIDGIFDGAGGRYIMDELNRGAAGTMPAAGLADIHSAIVGAYHSGNPAETRRPTAKTRP